MKIAVVLGTRPELIKLAPVIRIARERGHEVVVVSSGQHREMLKPLFRFFGIKPDLNLDVMRPNQGLTGLSARVLQALDRRRDVLKDVECVVVQGDTTTALIAGYWAFCQRIPVAHVEAGLRTGDLSAPFPEEANRQLLSRISAVHFAPTRVAGQNLRQEGIASRQVSVTGNTSIDSLVYTLGRFKKGEVAARDRLPEQIAKFGGGAPLVLVTAHRRESFGAGFEGICRGILASLKAVPELKVIYPVHPNPNVRKPVEQRLGRHPRILLCDPQPYVAFTELMSLADVILTDSGGVQEEGPTLRKPILVLREKTERPEGVQAGLAKLVGTDPRRISSAVVHALKTQGRGARSRNPYGDGRAAERIVQWLERHKRL